MPIPQFVVDLRRHVGHAPLWLTGVSAVVCREDGAILLTERADTGEWAVVSGILEPGEQPATAIVREIAEETGVVATVERLTGVDVTPTITYANGDQCRYLDLCFLARHVSGTPHVADLEMAGGPENTAVAWFAPDDLPVGLAASSVSRIETARSGQTAAWFAPPDP